MNYLWVLCVQVIKRVQQLVAPGEYLVRWKRAALVCHHLCQIVAGDVLHDQKLTIAFAKMIAHARQSRMMHARKQTRLALKLSSQALVGKQSFLECDGGIETLIDRFVDCTHAALAELL